jgi:hypothetical protein
VGAAEIRQPRDHHTRVGDRLLKRWEMDTWISDRVICQGRQRVAIGLRDVLSRDSASWTAATASDLHLAIEIGLTRFAPIDVRPLVPGYS